MLVPWALDVVLGDRVHSYTVHPFIVALSSVPRPPRHKLSMLLLFAFHWEQLSVPAAALVVLLVLVPWALDVVLGDSAQSNTVHPLIVALSKVPRPPWHIACISLFFASQDAH